MELDERLRSAVQGYWTGRVANRTKQERAEKLDAGSRGEVTGGRQMASIETLLAELLIDAGVHESEIRTRTELEIPGHFRATKKWDLVVCSKGRLVAAMELKSQAGKSIGNNVNNRTEEALGSAGDIWTAFREGRLGSAPPPFIGYFFLLEDQPKIHTSVRNKEPHFLVDPVFTVEPQSPSRGKRQSSKGVSYAKRYEILCRRLVFEKFYSASCFVLATNDTHTQITEPAHDLSFRQFVAMMQGHVRGFLGAVESGR